MTIHDMAEWMFDNDLKAFINYGYYMDGAYDPWCKKCPFFYMCVAEQTEPTSLSCDDWRYRAGHLAVDPWIDVLGENYEIVTGRRR